MIYHKLALNTSIRKRTIASIYILCYRKSQGHAKIKWGGKIQLDYVSTRKMARMVNILVIISHAKLEKLQHNVVITNPIWGVKAQKVNPGCATHWFLNLEKSFRQDYSAFSPLESSRSVQNQCMNIYKVHCTVSNMYYKLTIIGYIDNCELQ